MPSVAIARPEGDSIEHTLSDWATSLIQALSGSSGITISDLKGSSITRSSIDRELASNDLFLYFGHGLDDRLGILTTWIDNSNVAHASKRILIGIACKAANQLGPSATASGIRAFLGFDDDLVVYFPTPNLFGTVIEAALSSFILYGTNIAALHQAITVGFQAVEMQYRGPLSTHPDAEVIWLAAHINHRGIALCGDPKAHV